MGSRMEADVEQGSQKESVDRALRRRRWYNRRDMRFFIVVAALVGLYIGYGYVSASDRITPELAQELASGADRINIRITTEFPPEEFHMGIYQDAGSIRGTEGTTTTVFRVKPEDVRRISRYYWVSKLELAPAQ